MYKWIKSAFVALIIASIFALYLSTRRGYINLYIINKVAGSTAAVLAGLTLLLGSLVRSFGIGKNLLVIRRELGLMALGFGLIHSVISLLFLTEKFPLSWYMKEWIPVLFGFLALAIWIYLFTISSPVKIKKLGNHWMPRLQLGANLAFFAIYLHLGLMKYQGWMKWLNGTVQASPELANPSYPPASMFVFAIMTVVILYRIVRRITL